MKKSSSPKPSPFSGLSKDLRTGFRFFSLSRKLCPRYLPLKLADAVYRGLRPFPGILIPKYLIDELTGGQNVARLLFWLLLMVAIDVVFEIVGRILTAKCNIANLELQNAFSVKMRQGVLRAKYEVLEDPETLDLKQKALDALQREGGMFGITTSTTSILSNAVSLIGLVAIIATLDWVLIGVTIVMVAVNLLIYRRQQAIDFDCSQKSAVIDRRLSYCHDLSCDFSVGKDIRLYDMGPYIVEKFRGYHRQAVQFIKDWKKEDGRLGALSGIVANLQLLIVYGYMVFKVFAHAISLGDYAMYISAASTFSDRITRFFNNFIWYRTCCRYMCNYLDFLDLPPDSEDGTRPVPDEFLRPGGMPDIEFQHVWFRYPRSREYVLKDVSLTLRAGEKLSVVGPNGAGKTTFIKLLCRLYRPDRGRILLGGVDIAELGQEEYRRLLAVVFQDYRLFSFSMMENIAFSQSEGDARQAVMAALDQAGVGDRIRQLDRGIDTSLYRNFDIKGVELSGGETQKLAIARAIYKQAPVVVLDEPTAALDPYAESEIYTRFNEMVGQCTAVYISHRLSSCRFCDRVAVFDHGELTELGTHEELAARGGRYSDMWNAQAQYYI